MITSSSFLTGNDLTLYFFLKSDERWADINFYLK